MKFCVEPGAGLPAERAGGTGTSEKDFDRGESAVAVIPRPGFCVAAAELEEVRAGWLIVGVVGRFSDLEVFAEGFAVEGFNESPRAGRSTRD